LQAAEVRPDAPWQASLEQLDLEVGFAHRVDLGQLADAYHFLGGLLRQMRSLLCTNSFANVKNGYKKVKKLEKKSKYFIYLNLPFLLLPKKYGLNG
jgi:hypothetical protein